MADVDAPVAVVGGGIAGAATVLNLLRRNFTRVALYESSPDLTSSTSSVIAGTVSFDRFHRILREESDARDALALASDALATLSAAAAGDHPDELRRLSSFAAHSARFRYVRRGDVAEVQRRVYRVSHGAMMDAIERFPRLCSAVIGQWCCDIGGEAARHLEEALDATGACAGPVGGDAPPRPAVEEERHDSHGEANPFGAFRLLTDEMCSSVRRDAMRDAYVESGCDDVTHSSKQACTDAGHGYQTVDYKYYNMSATQSLVGDFVLSDPNVQCSIVEQRLTGFVRTEKLFEWLSDFFTESGSVTMKLGCLVTNLASNGGTNNSITITSECKQGGDGDEIATLSETYNAVIVAASVASVPLLSEIDPDLGEHLISVRGNGRYGVDGDGTPTVRPGQRGRAAVFQEAASRKKAAYARATSGGKVKVWGGAVVDATDADVRPPYAVPGDDALAELFDDPPAAEVSRAMHGAGAGASSCVRPVPSLGPLPLIKRYGGEWSGLYLNTGYGFNGYDLCWFSSDCVASMLAGEEVDDACRDAQFGRMIGGLALPSYRGSEASPGSVSTYSLSLAIALLLMALISIVYIKKEKGNSNLQKSALEGDEKDNVAKEYNAGCPKRDFAELTYVSALSQTQRSFSPPVWAFGEFLRRLNGKTAGTARDDELEYNQDVIKVAQGIFDIIDKDSSGFLDKEEVLYATQIMVEHGLIDLDGSSATCYAEKLIREFDANCDGVIDLNEFKEMMRLTAKKGLNTNAVRSDCSILDSDICLFLRSRYNVGVGLAEIRDVILPGLSTSDNGNNKIDLTELTATIFMPALLKTTRDEYEETLASRTNISSVDEPPCAIPSSRRRPMKYRSLEEGNMIERVLLIILRDIGVVETIISSLGDTRVQYPLLNKHILRKILVAYGESELASDDDLLEELLSTALGGHPLNQSDPVKLTPSVFARLLTKDIAPFLDIEEPQSKSTVDINAKASEFSTSIIDSTAALFKQESVHILLWIFVVFVFLCAWLSDFQEGGSFIQSGTNAILNGVSCPDPGESEGRFFCELWQYIVFWIVRSILMVLVGFIVVCGGSLGNITTVSSKKKFGLSTASISMLLLVGALPFYHARKEGIRNTEVMFYSQIVLLSAIASVVVIYFLGFVLPSKNCDSLEESRAQSTTLSSAVFKAEKMIYNALSLHDHVQTTSKVDREMSQRKLTRPESNSLNNVLLKFQAISSDSKGADIDFLLCWRKFLSGALLHQDGIWISARFLAINAVQLFVAALVLLLGINVGTYVVNRWEEGKRGKFLYDILTQVLHWLGLSVSRLGSTICEGAQELSHQLPQDLSQVLSNIGSEQGLSCEATIQSSLEAFLLWTSIYLFPDQKSMFTAPLIVSVAIAFGYSLFLAIIFIPSIVSTTLRFRDGSIGFKDDPYHFEVYRERMDRPYELLGTMVWTTVLGPLMFGGIWGLLLFLVMWQVTRDLMSRLIAFFMGISITVCLRWAFGLFFVDTAIRGFYRVHVNRFNICGLAVECIMVGLGIALAAFRAFICVVISMMYIGRADKILFDSKITIGLGHPVLRTRDHLPVSFRKEILLHEAHRHPYIEVLGKVYLAKLGNRGEFTSRAGCSMRLVFVQALMPWLRRYRQVARKNVKPSASDWMQGSSILSNIEDKRPDTMIEDVEEQFDGSFCTAVPTENETPYCSSSDDVPQIRSEDNTKTMKAGTDPGTD